MSKVLSTCCRDCRSCCNSPRQGAVNGLLEASGNSVSQLAWRLKHAAEAAGTIAQVYEALARELGLPANQKPMEVLLLVELLPHRAPTKFTEGEALLSQIKERAQLLVYRYASRASGPQSEGKETHLFHRSVGWLLGFCSKPPLTSPR